MISRVVALSLAFSVILLSPTTGDTAKHHKPRFKVIERTYDSDTFISLPGINLASRYPDAIDVTGPRNSRIIDVDLHLYGLSHGMSAHIDILLVAPNGDAALVMSDAGDQAIASAITLTLDDDAKRQLPRTGAISGGRYRPANYDEDGSSSSAGLGVESEPGSVGTPGEEGEPGGDGTPGEPGDPGDPGDPGGNPGFIADEFPAPAPDSGAAYRLTTFNGVDPSGTWQLFIRPDGPAAGQISDGWGLTIEVKKRR